MRVVDHSGLVTFVLHDHKGHAMLKKSCSKILNWFQTEGGMNDRPLNFAQLLEKEIIFKVKSNSRDNLDLEHCSEDGCSICDESPDSISLLDKFNMLGAPSIKKKR
ncbi:hypothetical protein Ahy_A10g048398 [Arachis hypogaea]|uniref:Uncharacterized protein n=1 Tax=Arachis hypogaea TaxID=3818 RepID=A0A445B562_ARAHY|nr:hypothetical protein Ahy_A10g048398 [Arachis hypogaea]